MVAMPNPAYRLDSAMVPHANAVVSANGSSCSQPNTDIQALDMASVDLT